MIEQKATNISWHEQEVTAEEREKMKGHQGAVLWFTGLSGSGKSTLATAIDAILFRRGHHTYVLDGDNVRHGLNKDLGFSPEDRQENIRRIGEVAHLFADAGIIAITAFISPYTEDRRTARGVTPKGHFVEVFCECPIEVCESRDPKGLYKKARSGEINNFTGIDAPYETPEKPEVIVHTDQQSVEESAQVVIDYLEKQGAIPRG